jgi:hypothetical protein
MAKLATEITNGKDGEVGTGEWGRNMMDRMGDKVRMQPQAHAEMLKMLNGVIGVEETAEVLRTLKSGKRVGSDKRANEGWKAAAAADEFATLVAEMWNEVWDEVYQPSEWMKNLVGLLYKGKGPVEFFGNYRGLTFSQHIVKAYEEMLKRRMTKFMEALKLYQDAQYGGRQGRSPVHAIIMSVLVLAGRRRTVIIVTDLAKAFPSTKWDAVVVGYFKMGVCGKMLRMICKMLQGMTSQVEVGNETSTEYQVVAGLVEGRVMCPMSFCVTVSELSSLLAEAGRGLKANGEVVTIVQFIDDNKIFCDDMDSAHRALDVLDKDAHMRGA